MFLLYYMETSYTIFTHVQWEGARGSTLVGLHCDCAAGCTQWGHGSVKVLYGCDCIQTFSEIKI